MLNPLTLLPIPRLPKRNCYPINSLWLLLLLLLLLTNQSWAQVVSSVDRNPIRFGESLTLSVQCTAGEEPDFSLLTQGFEVLRQTSSNNFSIINGSVSRKKIWTIILMPKRIGDIIIPALGQAASSSTPLRIRVLPANATTPLATASLQDILLEINTSTQTTWVQAQVLLTVRLLHKNKIVLRNASLSEPSNDNIVVKKIGEDKRYGTQRSGIAYQVIERHYALFPQQSGTITIPALRFEGMIVNSANTPLNPFGQFGQSGNTGQIKRVQSQVIKLKVQAKPATWQSLWLPATQIIISEQWPTVQPDFRVGEPITRTLEIVAHGLTAAQLPSLIGNLPDSLRQYPDKAELHDGADAKGLVSQRKQSVAIVPEQAGSFMLPAISLPWWNTVTGKAETATLAARLVSVGKIQGSGIRSQGSGIVNRGSEIGEQDSGNREQGAVVSGQPVSSVPSWFWPVLVVFLVIGWLGTIFAYYKHSTREVSQQRQRAIAAKQESLRLLRKRIKTACDKHDAISCRTALLSWAAVRWQHVPPIGLADLAAACDALGCAELRDTSKELNSYLYLNNSRDDIAWHGGYSLWTAWQQTEQFLKTQQVEQAKIKTKRAAEALRPLS